MTPEFVVDCSIAASWCFFDEATAATRSLLKQLGDSAAVAPGLWRLEIVNVLAVAERKKRIGRSQADQFLAMLASLDVQLDDEGLPQAFDHLTALCRNHQLSSYDATYVELAVRRRLPLATLDRPLRKAAKKLGVELLGM